MRPGGRASCRDEGIERFAAAVAAGTTNQDVLAETFALLRQHIYAEEEFRLCVTRAW
ncbi:MAG: hypothetical protein R2709_04215 [Marmoricola sp.]